MIKFILTLLVVLVLSGDVVYSQELGQSKCLVTQQRDPEILDNVYVSVEFSIDIQDFKQHTYFVNAFNAAVVEWAKHIPIRTTFYFDGLIVPFFPIGSPVDRLNIIRIVFADLQGKPYNFAKNIIGMWSPGRRSILFDTDYFQKNPEEIYSVALHELGHLFGLPHIVNKHELGYTGYLVLAEGDATDYVMYPAAFTNKPQDQLSELEIHYARHQVMYIFSLDQLMMQRECQIAVDDR
jgi:hypothetical protein